MSFDKVPLELYAIIFDHLPIIDFEAARKVNKTWNILLGKYIRKHRNYDWDRIHMQYDWYDEDRPCCCTLESSQNNKRLTIRIAKNIETIYNKQILLPKILEGIWTYNVKTLDLSMHNRFLLSRELNDFSFWWLESIWAFKICPCTDTIDAPLLISRMPKLEHLYVATGALCEVNIIAMISNMRQISGLIISTTWCDVSRSTRGLTSLIIEKSKKSATGLYEWEFTHHTHCVRVDDIIKLFEEAFFDSKFHLSFTHLKGLEGHLDGWIEKNATNCRLKNAGCGLTTGRKYKERSFTYRNTEFTLGIENFSEWFLDFLPDDESLFSCLPFERNETSPNFLINS